MKIGDDVIINDQVYLPTKIRKGRIIQIDTSKVHVLIDSSIYVLHKKHIQLEGVQRGHEYVLYWDR